MSQSHEGFRGSIAELLGLYGWELRREQEDRLLHRRAESSHRDPNSGAPNPNRRGEAAEARHASGGRDQVPSPDRGPGRQDLRVQALLQQRAWRLQSVSVK